MLSNVLSIGHKFLSAFSQHVTCDGAHLLPRSGPFDAWMHSSGISLPHSAALTHASAISLTNLLSTELHESVPIGAIVDPGINPCPCRYLGKSAREAIASKLRYASVLPGLDICVQGEEASSMFILEVTRHACARVTQSRTLSRRTVAKCYVCVGEFLACGEEVPLALDQAL